MDTKRFSIRHIFGFLAIVTYLAAFFTWVWNVGYHSPAWVSVSIMLALISVHLTLFANVRKTSDDD